jgi:hypothetical protein
MSLVYVYGSGECEQLGKYITVILPFKEGWSTPSCLLALQMRGQI